MDILTERLSLRPTKSSDVPALFSFLGDAQAMRHTAHFTTLRACRRHVAGHEWQRRRLGCAPWTVRSRGDGAIIGWGGLFEHPFDPGWGVELDYWFAPAAWGQGNATELTAACIIEAGGAFAAAGTARLRSAGECRLLPCAGKGRLREPALHPELERHLYRKALAG